MRNGTAVAAALQPLLPLPIETVELQSGTLTIIGDAWSLNLIGEWTWHGDGDVVTGARQPAAEDIAWELRGFQLVGVHFPTRHSTVIAHSFCPRGRWTSGWTGPVGRPGRVATTTWESPTLGCKQLPIISKVASLATCGCRRRDGRT